MCLLVVRTEKVVTIVMINNLLLMLCMVFFFSERLLIMYVAYERTLVPVVYLIVLYGGQVEKVGATYYLVMYMLVCSLPFLFIIIWLGIEGGIYAKEFLT